MAAHRSALGRRDAFRRAPTPRSPRSLFSLRALAALVVVVGVLAALPALAAAPAALSGPALLAAPKFATVTARSCVVYESPDENASVKTRARRGEFFEVGGMRGQWIKVRTRKGVVGYVIKNDVIPGKKELRGPGPSPSRTPRSGRIGSGVTVEGRTGLLVKAGLGFAGNSYGYQAAGGFKRDIGMKTAYAGINADVEYWFIPLAGAHGRFSSTFGSMTAVLNEPINKRVDRIPTNINVIELDVQGRYFIGSASSAPSVLGRLGFHSHEMLIDPVVDQSDRPLFLVSNSYRGPVVGLGGDVPIGGPQMGVHALVNYWVAPSLTEGSTKGTKKPSGKPSGVSGIGLNTGFYYNLNDQTGIDVSIDYSSFSGTFSGSGRRFNTDVSKSKTTDTYVQFLVNGTYRF